MRTAYDVEAVRAAEDALMARVPPGELMQRAAAGLATVCASLLGGVYGARVVLLVGSGNNGGDALYAGARLAARGARVDALLMTERPHAGGLAALERAGGRAGMPAGRLGRGVLVAADLVVDGIVGIGGRGGLRGPAVDVVGSLDPRSRVVSVDVPSGVDASTGVVNGTAVRAAVTVTFGTLKPGLLVDPGAEHAGVVHLVDIGLGDDLPAEAPVEVLTAADVAALMPWPARESDKYRRGVLGVAAGSARYAGAAVLCTSGAVRGGAGMVRYVGDEEPARLVRERWPEAVVGAGRVQAWTVGSGGGDDAGDRLRQAVADGVPVVVDAEALAAVPDLPAPRPPLLLTPHAGELARLLGVDRGEVEANRLRYAGEAARAWDATVLLKGSTTVVTTREGRSRVNTTGTPLLATAGSGDVLAGLCGALLAGGLTPLDAGSVGAWLHGLAGRLAADGGGPVAASDIADRLPNAFAVAREGSGTLTG